MSCLIRADDLCASGAVSKTRCDKLASLGGWSQKLTYLMFRSDKFMFSKVPVNSSLFLLILSIVLPAKGVF